MYHQAQHKLPISPTLRHDEPTNHKKPRWILDPTRAYSLALVQRDRTGKTRARFGEEGGVGNDLRLPQPEE
jgi:hypothetical protein